MADILTGAYTWLLSLHLISVMFWMAGMYYLPRLFVYHAEAIENNEPFKVFERMEYNLIRIIINPAGFMIMRIRLYSIRSKTLKGSLFSIASAW